MSSNFPIGMNNVVITIFVVSVSMGWSLLLTSLANLQRTVRPFSNEFFLSLFVFRYLRLVVNTIFFCTYKPVRIPANPRYVRSDCTVIIPTTDPGIEVGFLQCLTTVLANNPAAVIVTTVGKENLAIARRMLVPINAANGHKIRVIQQGKGNKRRQICHAVPRVKTDIIVTVDATVFWPSTNFLPTILAPFEDEAVGVVGTYKRVVREPTGLTFKSFWNFIGCLYLERHNFEVAATTNIDGGAFVISGRTAAYRTEILADPAFIESFTNEMFFFGLCGPLNPDDDNFISRWVVRHGWKVNFQYSEDAMIQTRVGTYPRYLSQCLRWVRTTWRSNSATLFTDPFRADCQRSIYTAQPWSVYAVYITSFFNFALFTDAMLMYLVSSTTLAEMYGASVVQTCMLCFILASKLVKPFPHFRRNPADLIFLPGYILFGYYHSLLKLYALFTFWNCAWSGRVVKDASADVKTEGSDDTDDDDNDDCDGNYSEYFPSLVDTQNADDGFNVYVGSTRRGMSASPTSTTRTPWGMVMTSPHWLTPVNILEPHIPEYIGKIRRGGGIRGGAAPPNGKLCTSTGGSNTPPKLYTWTRGPHCERLHSEEQDFVPRRSKSVLNTLEGYTGVSRLK